MYSVPQSCTGCQALCNGGGVGKMGIWFGPQFTSGEHMVATLDGRVVRARSVHPRPDIGKNTREALANIQVGLWGPSDVITQGSTQRPQRMTEAPR